MDEVAKSEVNEDSIVIMEVLVDLSRRLELVNCTPRTSRLWNSLLELLKKAEETNDYVLKKAYLEKLRDVVPQVIRDERSWLAKGNAILLTTAIISLISGKLTLFNYLPWGALLLYQAFPSLALAALFLGGLMGFYSNPFLSALYLLASITSIVERGGPVDLEVKVPKARVSREEVEELFKKFYGEKTGRELFLFELYQLVISGKTVEEALGELWERLTGTQISSGEGSSEGRERVGAWRKDEGTENNNEASDNG